MVYIIKKWYQIKLGRVLIKKWTNSKIGDGE